MYTDCFTEASLDYAGVYSERLASSSANLSSALSKATPHFQLCLPQTHKPCSMTGLFFNAHTLFMRARSSMGIQQRLVITPLPLV